jgi:hypothetical protein
MKHLKTFNESSEDKDVKRKIKEKKREIEKLKIQYQDIDKSKVSAHKSVFKSKLSKLEQELKELNKTNEGFNLFGYRFGDDFKKSPAYTYALDMINQSVKDGDMPAGKETEALDQIGNSWNSIVKKKESRYKGGMKELLSDTSKSGLSEEGEEAIILAVGRAERVARGEESVDYHRQEFDSGHGQPGMRYSI